MSSKTICTESNSNGNGNLLTLWMVEIVDTVYAYEVMTTGTGPHHPRQREFVSER
jgi:hypothetical protein